MSNNIFPSIERLPVELFHRIFDDLDARIILYSIRPLSRLLGSIVNTYNRYVLNFNLISKPNFYLFCRLIYPENIISLTLSNDERTLDQIDLFISLVNLRLHSLTIKNFSVNIDELELFLLLTSSLVYLKLIGGEKMINGKRWEQFIQINLPQLDKFEILF